MNSLSKQVIQQILQDGVTLSNEARVYLHFSSTSGYFAGPSRHSQPDIERRDDGDWRMYDDTEYNIHTTSSDEQIAARARNCTKVFGEFHLCSCSISR